MLNKSVIAEKTLDRYCIFSQSLFLLLTILVTDNRNYICYIHPSHLKVLLGHIIENCSARHCQASQDVR